MPSVFVCSFIQVTYLKTSDSICLLGLNQVDWYSYDDAEYFRQVKWVSTVIVIVYASNFADYSRSWATFSQQNFQSESPCHQSPNLESIWPSDQSFDCNFGQPLHYGGSSWFLEELSYSDSEFQLWSMATYWSKVSNFEQFRNLRHNSSPWSISCRQYMSIFWHLLRYIASKSALDAFFR